MISPLETEALFSAIGLERILRARASLHKYQLRQAAVLDDDIRRRLLRFVSTDNVTEAADMPPFDFDEVQSWLSTNPDEGGAVTLDPEQSAALFDAVPDPELAQSLAIHANKILTWAQPLVPREAQSGVMGVSVQQPTGSTLSDFRMAWQVAADPMVVMADLEDGSLSPDEVATLAELYPEIYAEMRQALSDALAAMAARRGEGWEPGPRKSDLIGLLRQQQATDPELTAAIQQVYAEQPQPQPPKPSRSKGKGEMAEATPGQEAAAGK